MGIRHLGPRGRRYVDWITFMSNNNDKQYTTQELNAMSNEDLARLGTELDDVTIAYRKERFPIANDPAEKRAARAVTFWLVLGIIGGLGFLATYIFWPWEYKAHGDEGLLAYTLYTPMLGITSGLCILSLGFAVVLYVKKFIPEEIAVQRRHDGPSEEVDRRTIVALLNDSWQTSTLGRRKLIMGLAGGGAVLAGLTIIAPMGGMIKNPWNPKEGPMDVQGDGTLWTSGWTLVENDVKVYLGRDTAAIAESHTDATGEHWSTTGVSRLVRMRPEDLAAASMETVFPLPAEMVNDGAEYDPAKDVYEHQMHSVHGPRNAVMLIRLRTADAEKVIEREARSPSTTVTTTLTPRFVHTLVAQPHCTRLRPIVFCAHVTSRSLTHCTTESQSLDLLPVHCHSCQLPLMKRLPHRRW